MRRVLSILVDNQAGVLSRISGLFSRRGYNIDSLSVGETEDPAFSRITVVVRGDDLTLTQIARQVEKLADCRELTELNADASVCRELALVKVSADAPDRSDIVGIVEIFRANIIDVSNSSITVELTGDENKIAAFMELMRPYGIIEMARTGLTGLKRGPSSLRKDINVG